MKHSRWIRYGLLSTLIAFFALPAFALDLQQARAQAQVGEQQDGYIAALSPSPEAQQLAAEVNARRKQEYQRISQEKNQPVDVVAKLAAAQIMQKLEPGSMYQGGDGSWKKR